MLLSHPVTVSAPPAPPGFKLTLGTLTLLHCGSGSMFSGKGNCHFCASTSDSLSRSKLLLHLLSMVVLFPMTALGMSLLLNSGHSERVGSIAASGAALTCTHTLKWGHLVFIWSLSVRVILKPGGEPAWEHKPKLKRGEWKNERNFSLDDATEAPT